MPRRKLLQQIIFPYLTVILASLIAITWFTYRELHEFYVDQTAHSLQARARLVEGQFTSLLPAGHSGYAAVDSLCKGLGRASSTRLTVMLPDGTVIGDTQEDPATMENHRGREEMAAALRQEVGRSVRYSNTLQVSMLYVALPLLYNGQQMGVIRAAVPLSAIDSLLHSLLTKIALAGLLIAVLAGWLSIMVVRRISGPIEELKRGAERFAQGDLSGRLVIPNSEEIGRLAEAMNSMAVQLEERITTITRQRNEQEAILTSMAEGVIAVDSTDRILNINDAAAQLLGIEADGARGRGIQEVVRNSDLQRLIKETRVRGSHVEGEIVLRDKGEKFIRIHGAVLKGAGGDVIGALVVLNDMTKVRRLENIRREFVANVSHELKTPITSIKGYVETLLENETAANTETSKFLEVIARQADRLGALVHDLLNLSKIEKEAEAGEVTLAEGELSVVLEVAVQACQVRAADKGVVVTIDCPATIMARINTALMEQAVINLVDNAIKYSEAGTTVTVKGEKTEREVRISVIDRGTGIKEEHLGRIFERFYRVDKARSRDLGGTGLGLAIVKHIAIAHHGKVTVDSTFGLGSTFCIRIPTSI